MTFVDALDAINDDAALRVNCGMDVRVFETGRGSGAPCSRTSREIEVELVASSARPSAGGAKGRGTTRTRSCGWLL